MLESIFYIIAAIQIMYYGILFSRIFSYKRSPKLANNPGFPVSVIICAHNESHHLRNYLPLILQQDYPEFEVVLVNDASTDNSDEVLITLKNTYPNLRIVTITPEEKTVKGKKQALEKGIQLARYEHLLLTDADCFPASLHWIKNIVAHFSDRHHLILGVAPYTDSGSFLQKVVAYETTMTAIQYISFAFWKIPYMGVGRNMAYTRTLFNKTGGMQKHRDILSGDDDLFVQEAVYQTDTSVCLEPESYIYSAPPATWKAWWRQKTRHYTTGARYNILHQLLLGLFLVTKVTFYLLLSFLVTKDCKISYALVYLLILSVNSFFLLFMKIKFEIKAAWYMSFLLDPIYALMVVIQSTFSNIKNISHWK